MEEAVLPQSTVLGTSSDTFMDLDFMDELLLEGCWVEPNGSEFSQFDASAPFSPFSPSFMWPNLTEQNHGELSGSPNSNGNQEERQRSSFPENLSISQSQGPFQNYLRPQSQNIGSNAGNSFGLSDNYLLESSEQNKRWWAGPKAPTSVADRLSQAISFIKDRTKDKNVLIQVWVPVNRGGKRVLVTNDQPVMFDLNSPQLAHYRDISVNYQFSTEEGDAEDTVGLPGRVFRSKVPEWTPDVQFFSRDEYPRVGHAQQYDVRGTLAVPVLERGSRSCLGVIEVVLTKQKIKYRPELENVCQALEAVDLSTSEVSRAEENVKTFDISYQAALPEILNVLKSACQAHALPLAQTWISCPLQGKGGCRHSEENFKNCIAPVESACYLNDPEIQGFHEACTEYHLLKDQGIVGKAFNTNQPCFSADVTACSKTEYPLSHHARMFGLKAAVAIRLRSICTGSVDFVLEFFLPVKCLDPEDQRIMLNSLSTIIQNTCQTLTVVTEEELQEESNLANPAENTLEADQMQLRKPYSLNTNKENGNDASTFQNERCREMSAKVSEVGLSQPESNSREGITFTTNPSTSGDGSSLHSSKAGEKRRVKAEKTITLQVLRQHFAGSLKDAAKNLGVCPTTLKRICRHHGIQRWPSRKIKKVGHSLQKIQRVIDSVEGASGVLQIGSFYSNFPELASPDASKTTQFSKSSPTHPVKLLDGQPDISTLSPHAAASLSPSSSCSQTSGSSQCYSSGKPPKLSTSAGGFEDLTVKEEPDEPTLKRARSDANLHLSSNGTKPIHRSQSDVSFWDLAEKPENPPVEAKQQGVKTPAENDSPRIKVTFGEDAIRFRMQSKWRYKDLLEEISRRFGIRDSSGFHLKYLDDDSEWVLLTCDADLEECIDVCHSSANNTIKLSFSFDPRSQFSRPFSTVRGSFLSQ